MMQFDFTQDLQALQRHLHSQLPNTSNSRPFFLHANFSKLNSVIIFLNKSFRAAELTRDADETIRRVWHKSGIAVTAFFGFDLERRLWKEIREIACEYEGSLSM
jgi:hypothetical protein